jgi:hypothetical protein
MPLYPSAHRYRETSFIEVEGWCRDCRKTRAVKVADLLEAVSSDRRSVVRA